jgi:hypothetical protein
MRHCSIWRAICVNTLHHIGVLTFISTLRNIAELLVDKGLASVVRHKRDDEDRSSDYDKLMVAEQA